MKGFGDPSGNFWIGLEALHILTNSANFKIKVQVKKPSTGNDIYYVGYNIFIVGDSSGDYVLTANGLQQPATMNGRLLLII